MKDINISPKYFVLFIPLFLINPFFTITLMLFVSMLYPFYIKDNAKVLLFLLALFMGLIQSTRIIRIGEPSDWAAGYMPFFLNAGNMSFIQYIQEEAKEPCFSIINYIGYYFFSGNFVLFATVLVSIMYFAVYISIYQFWKANSKDIRCLLIAIVFFSFLTENIGMTNNLLRQQFAMGLMIYVYVQKTVNNKMNWWIAIIACLTHTFMFLFLLLLFVQPLYKIIHLKTAMQLLLALGVVAIFFRLASSLSQLFSGLDSLSYGFYRIGKEDIERDSAYMISGGVLIFFNILLFLLITFKLNYWDKPLSNSQVFFTNLLLFIMIICAIFEFVNPMIQTRLYGTRNFFIPFVISILFYKNQRINGLYAWSVVIFFYVRFLVKFDSLGNGGFFPPISELITQNILYFL